jgi:hypothetical protein
VKLGIARGTTARVLTLTVVPSAVGRSRQQKAGSECEGAHGLRASITVEMAARLGTPWAAVAYGPYSQRRASRARTARSLEPRTGDTAPRPVVHPHDVNEAQRITLRESFATARNSSAGAGTIRNTRGSPNVGVPGRVLTPPPSRQA